MGKKPFIRLAGMFLAGVSLASIGCGQCTSCNTRPGKFNTPPVVGKAPTPAIGDKKSGVEVVGDTVIKPSPVVTEAPPTGGPGLPSGSTPAAPLPSGPAASMKRETQGVTPVSMQDNLPGREPTEGAVIQASHSQPAFSVPPTPVRSTLGDSSPMGKPAELPTSTTSRATPIPSGVPMESPPAPQPPVSATPAPQPVPGTGPITGTPLPPIN